MNFVFSKVNLSKTHQVGLSSVPLSFGQQLLHALQSVLQDVHLEQKRFSLHLQPTQLLHHLVIAGLQLQLCHKQKLKSTWAAEGSVPAATSSAGSQRQQWEASAGSLTSSPYVSR